jgi:heterodisulfide reductase subunit A
MSRTEASVIVVGGGIGGLSAASALADLGLDVLVVEKAPRLGGNAAAWACMATDECARCSACVVQEQVRQVAHNPRIRVLVGCRVAGLSGGPGAFRLHVEPSGEQAEEKPVVAGWLPSGPADLSAKRVLLTTGFVPYDPAASPLLSYGRLDEVFTTRDVDHILRKDSLEEFLPASIEKPRIAFLQCVGSRDRARGRNYCSQFCCKATVRLANRLMHLRPEAGITVYYIDLQIMGKEFRSFYRKVAGRVRFLQGVPDQVDYGWDENKESVTLRSKDPLTGEATAETYDRVVLSIGIAPRAGGDSPESLFGLERNDCGFLARGKGADLFRTSREGVYAAGASVGPTDINGTRTQSLAAAASIARDLGLDAAAAVSGT